MGDGRLSPLFFRTLREAGLVRCERRGVEIYNTTRRAEIDHRFPGLIAALLDAYARQRSPASAMPAEAL
jgi:hypothetical protein